MRKTARQKSPDVPYEAPRQTIEKCQDCDQALIAQTFSHDKGWRILPEPVTAGLGLPHTHGKDMEIDF